MISLDESEPLFILSTASYRRQTSQSSRFCIPQRCHRLGSLEADSEISTKCAGGLLGSALGIDSWERKEKGRKKREGKEKDRMGRVSRKGKERSKIGQKKRS